MCHCGFLGQTVIFSLYAEKDLFTNVELHNYAKPEYQAF
jgi:hypothetical protein